MAIFKRVSSDNQKGKVSYSTGIVNGIINLAVSEIEGVAMHGGKKGIKLYFENADNRKQAVSLVDSLYNERIKTLKVIL